MRCWGHDTCALAPHSPRPNQEPKTKSHRYGSLRWRVWLQCQISSKRDPNASWKGPSSTWWGETTSWILNPLLVEFFWGLRSFEMLIRHETGRWKASGAADTDAVLPNTRGHAACTSAGRRSAPRWKAAGCDVSEELYVRAGSALAVRCAPSARTGQQ